MRKLVYFCEERYSPFYDWGGEEPVMLMYEMVHIAVWYLANECVLREIALKFDRTISSVWRAIKRVISILETHQDEFIKWPSIEEAPAIASTFACRAGFPGAIGSIDGTHISIDAPKTDEKDYINRKMFHSINVLAVVLPNRMFSYTFVGYPGR